MRTVSCWVLTGFMTSFVHGVELQALAYKVLHDERAYVRDDSDRRYSVWTANQVKAAKTLNDFGLVVPAFSL